MGESIAGAPIPDSRVIRRTGEAYSARGGLALLTGNLAPGEAVVKTGSFHPALRRFAGPARF